MGHSAAHDQSRGSHPRCRHRRGRRRPAEPSARRGGRSPRPPPAKPSSAPSRSAATPTKPSACSRPSSKPASFTAISKTSVYTPKTLKALESVRHGALGKILWVRSRETHSGPHSDWFWNKELSGGGAIIDLGCHCIEIARNFIGKDIRPVEVMCWGDTQVHPIEAEDHAIGLVRYENGAIGQFEVSWTFRGGMDLRDEVAGTEGTIWLNHWLRTGIEMFTAVGQAGYVAEKAEGDTGWLFPSATKCSALGYVDMFTDMFDAIDDGAAPRKRFTTATSSTRSSTPPTPRSNRRSGSRSNSKTGAAAKASPTSPTCATTTPTTCSSKKNACPTAPSSSSSATNKPAKSASAPV